MRSRAEHAAAAMRLLSRAEGELRCAAAADLGVPPPLLAACELPILARELVQRAFGPTQRLENERLRVSQGRAVTCCRIGCKSAASVVVSVVGKSGTPIPVYAVCSGCVPVIGGLPLPLVFTYGEPAADMLANQDAKNLAAGRPS